MKGLDIFSERLQEVYPRRMLPVRQMWIWKCRQTANKKGRSVFLNVLSLFIQLETGVISEHCLSQDFIKPDIGVFPEPGIIRAVPVISHDKIGVLRDFVRTKAAFYFLRGKTVIQRFFAAVNLDVPVFDLHCLSGESDDPLYI